MQTPIMQARMGNPAMVVPDAMQALMALGASVKGGGVPSRTLRLVYLRASQINGCSLCVDMHSRDARKAGETDERLFAVAAWREAPYFTDAERGARARRGCYPTQRPGGPRTGRGLGRGRQALLRAGARGPDPLDRHGQPLEPPQRLHQAGGWGVDRLSAPLPSGSLSSGSSTRVTGCPVMVRPSNPRKPAWGARCSCIAHAAMDRIRAQTREAGRRWRTYTGGPSHLNIKRMEVTQAHARER
jgi:AhpD family alkylhydroperoxidase